MTDIGTLGGKGFSEGFDISDGGTVVGSAITRAGNQHAFSYAGGKMKDLGVLSGGTDSEARAINSLGQIVGVSWTFANGVSGNHRAFLYGTAGLQDLGTLGGSQADAYDINGVGQVVGDAQDSSGSWHGFLYSSGLMLTLGGSGSSARSINDSGEIVGSSNGRAVIFQGGTAIDLNTLIPAGSPWVLGDANAINNAGQIVGTGTYSGLQRAYLLTPSRLGRYAPEIRYDSQETYRVDSAAEATDNYTSTYSNKLWQGATGTLLADANPDQTAVPHLSMDYLNSVYQSAPTDYIDEADNNYVADFNRLHAQAMYANQTYGRDFVASNGDHVLQYWFYLYYNQKTFLGFGAHEGDWEGIQVHLNASGTPVDAAYSQHGGAVVCPWANVEHSGAHPVVYSAWGSHASYFTSGSHSLAGGQTDNGDGLGEHVVPGVVDITTPPQWLSWQGEWGGSNGVDPSPTGPGQKGQEWSDPLAWQATQSACKDGAVAGTTMAFRAISKSAAPKPPAPKVHIAVDGAYVVTSYHFSTWPSDKTTRPAAILSSVVSSNPRYTPMTRLTKISGPTGSIKQKLVGGGPYKVLVSALSATGARSAVQTLRVR
jgi:probable HAF family extracellular repeat protein